MGEKDWKHELNNKESVICLDLSLKMKPNNEIYLDEKEMYEYCGYKSFRYFEKHLESLLDKFIIIKVNKVNGKNRYFFNPVYLQYDESGPKMYHRPLVEKDVMKEVLAIIINDLD
jgi:hypothetical protein